MEDKIISNRYKILEFLGKGGMGEVYKVFDLIEKDIKALKLFNQNIDNSSVNEIKKEFQIMSVLEHPYICKVFDFGMLENGIYFISMEFIDGKNIFESTEKLSLEDKVDLIIKICRGLAYIHSNGLIHFDIKPENIILKNKEPKIMDFGLSSLKRKMKETGIKGTPVYIPLELLNNEVADARCDLYSLGVTLFEILTRRKPFAGNTIEEIIKSKMTEEPIFFENEKMNIPEEIRKIILKLMERLPADRYENAYEVISAIIPFSKNKDFRIESIYFDDIIRNNLLKREVGIKTFAEIVENENPCLTLIRGSKGSGKSTILKEFELFLKSNEVAFFSTSSSDRGKIPYKTIIDLFTKIIVYKKEYVDLFEKYYEFLTNLIPNINELLNFPNKKSQIIFKKREDFFEGLFKFLLEIVERKNKIVLIFENLSEIEIESLEFLKYILQNLKSNGLIIVGEIEEEFITEKVFLKTFLKELKDKNLIRFISINNFSQEEVRKFLSRVYFKGKDLEEISSLIFDKTRGNPLFIKRVLNLLLDKGIAVWNKDRLILSEFDLREIDFFDEFNKSIKEKISSVDEISLKILKIGSIVGKCFEYKLLQNFLQIEDKSLNKCLAFLKNERFVDEFIENDKYFYNLSTPEIGEVLLKLMDNSEKKEYNIKIGEILESIFSEDPLPILDEIGFFFYYGEEWIKAFEYFYQAGINARKRYAPKRAIQYFNHCVEIIKKNEEIIQPQKIMELYHITGITLEGEGEYVKAFEMFKNLVDVAKINKNENKMAEGLENLGTVSWRLGNYLDAIKFHTESIKIREKIGNNEGIARSLSFIGSIYWTMGENLKALNYYEKALPVFKKIGDKIRTAGTYHNIGLVYYNMGKIEKGFQCLQTSLRIFKKEKDIRSVGRNLHTISSVYYMPKALIKDALRNYKKAMKCFEEVGDPQGVAACLRDIGTALSIKSKFNDAVETTKRGLNIFQNIGEKRGIATSLLALGEVYLSMESYGKALHYLEEAQNISHKISEKHMIIMSSNSLGNLYRELGDTEKAINIHEECLKDIKKYGLEKFEDGIIAGYGMDLMFRKDFDVAQKYLEKAVVLAIKNYDNFLAISLYPAMAELYHYLDMERKYYFYLNKTIQYANTIPSEQLLVKAFLIKGKFSEDEKKREYLESARMIAKKIYLPNTLFEINALLSKYYLDKKYYRNSFDYAHKAVQILSTICNELKEDVIEKFLKTDSKILIFKITEELKKLTIP